MSKKPKIERLLVLMAKKSASDLYLSADAPIMLRINGSMIAVNEEQRLSANEIHEELGTMFDAEKMEELYETKELNVGVFREGIGNFRFSCFFQRGTLAAVARYIPLKIPAFDTLNLPKTLANLALVKRGLIIFAGSTGCGKSTSIASLLDLRNTHMTGHILTIEDPIEYYFTNQKSIINQREVGADTHSLHIGLKNTLRQRPDSIFIGEIRDVETMSAALSYAQSGHMCISTLHANNSYEALTRILSFFPEETRHVVQTDLASALKCVVTQRLVRSKEGKLYPAVEVLENSRLIAGMIAKGDLFNIQDAMEKSLAEGSQTFEEDLARMVNTDLIDESEAIENSDSAANLLWRLKNSPRITMLKKLVAMEEGEEDEDDTPQFTKIDLGNASAN